MLVEFAFICDYAEVTGKINALGIGFDTIFAASVPARHPYFFLVFQLRANIVEAGEKNIVLSLIDEDGKNVVPQITGKFVVQKPKEGTESKARVALQFGNVEFPKYGSYSIHAVIDGHDMISIPLQVLPLLGLIEATFCTSLESIAVKNGLQSLLAFVLTASCESRRYPRAEPVELCPSGY